MLALHEVWILGIDYWYEIFSMVSLVNAALLFLFLLLAVSSNLRVHVAGAANCCAQSTIIREAAC